MTKDQLIIKYMQYSAFFSVYADLYALKRRIHQKKEKVSSNLVIADSCIGSMKEMIRDAETKGAVIYGRALINEYSEASEKSILLVSHELSLSGAPMALFNLAMVLKKHGWQTLIVSPVDGAIGLYAADHGIPSLYIPGLYRERFVSRVKNLFAVVIANTLVSSAAVKELDGTDTPVMWWIHEASSVYNRDMAIRIPRKMSENVCICCDGTYAKRLFEKRFPRYKTENLPCFVKDPSLDSVQIDLHSAEHAEGVKTYACVGLIEQRKGQDILLEAIDILPEGLRRKCRFIFVGKVADQEIKKKMEMMQKKYPGIISFYDGLGYDELFKIYRSMDVLICSSRDEPGPMVVEETLSLGKPCLCSRNTGNADIVKRYKAGFTYGKNDPRRLSKLIRRTYYLKNDEYRKLAENARLAYEEVFSEEVFVKNFVGIMKKLTMKR